VSQPGVPNDVPLPIGQTHVVRGAWDSGVRRS
jgi:hypothetical protein